LEASQGGLTGEVEIHSAVRQQLIKKRPFPDKYAKSPFGTPPEPPSVPRHTFVDAAFALDEFLRRLRVQLVRGGVPHQSRSLASDSSVGLGGVGGAPDDRRDPPEQVYKPTAQPRRDLRLPGRALLFGDLVGGSGGCPSQTRRSVIIIGAGVSGSIIAGELSKIGADVLIVEAGGADAAPTISNPSLARQPRDDQFRQPSLASHAVHDLDLARAAGDCPRKPISPRSRLAQTPNDSFMKGAEWTAPGKLRPAA
jgi:hypothetical protein